MSTSVEGFYRNGKVELLTPVSEADGSRVVGLDRLHASDLRNRLATFA